MAADLCLQCVIHFFSFTRLYRRPFLVVHEEVTTMDAVRHWKKKTKVIAAAAITFVFFFR